jgi:hypothetical protein
VSAIKRVEFVSDRMPYIILRSRWCSIIVLNVHAPTEDKIDIKDRFYEELEQVFDKFLKYHMKILLYSSPSIIRMIKSRRMRWAGHVARMEETTGKT